MILSEILTDIRRELNLSATTATVGPNELTAFVNRAQDLMASRIIEADQNFFEESDQTLGFIANQEEYDLPQALWNRKITRVVRTDLQQPVQLRRIRFQEKDHYYSTATFLAGASTEGQVYYIRGNKIGIKPTPTKTIATNILVNYLQLPQELHWADVGAASSPASTFTIPVATSGTVPLMRGGRVSTTPSYYIGARARILSDGSARGQERKITGFNVTTRVVTLESSWDAMVPSSPNADQYVILSPIPEEYHEGLYQYALMKAAAKIKDTERYQVALAAWARIWDSVTNTIEPRAFDENTHVRPPVDQHYD